MCISEWSSQIAGEIIDNPNEDWIDTPKQKIISLDDDSWKLLNNWIPFVRRVFMTGGEPTIIQRNLDYIDKIVESGHSGNVELIFTTNATNINQKFIDISKKFKSVSFNVSIDAVNGVAIEHCDINFGGIWFQLVTDPHYLDPIHAPVFMKEKCINDIESFLHRPFLNDPKYNNILFGELKQSLIQTKNFLQKNLDNVQHTNEFLKRMETMS